MNHYCYYRYWLLALLASSLYLPTVIYAEPAAPGNWQFRDPSTTSVLLQSEALRQQKLNGSFDNAPGLAAGGGGGTAIGNYNAYQISVNGNGNTVTGNTVNQNNQDSNITNQTNTSTGAPVNGQVNIPSSP